MTPQEMEQAMTLYKAFAVGSAVLGVISTIGTLALATATFFRRQPPLDRQLAEYVTRKEWQDACEKRHDDIWDRVNADKRNMEDDIKALLAAVARIEGELKNRRH